MFQGSGLSFRDLDNFAVFALTSNESYHKVLSVSITISLPVKIISNQCYNTYNLGLKDDIYDYPLCSAELKVTNFQKNNIISP